MRVLQWIISPTEFQLLSLSVGLHRWKHISWTQESWPRNRTLCCWKLLLSNVRLQLKSLMFYCIWAGLSDVMLDYCFHIVASCFYKMSLVTPLFSTTEKTKGGRECIGHWCLRNLCLHQILSSFSSFFPSVIPSSVDIFYGTRSPNPVIWLIIHTRLFSYHICNWLIK